MNNYKIRVFKQETSRTDRGTIVYPVDFVCNEWLRGKPNIEIIKMDTIYTNCSADPIITILYKEN